MKFSDWFTSSTDGQSIALRWKALSAGIVPILVLVGPLLGFEIAEEAWKELFGAVGDAIVQIWGLGSLIAFIWGWARRNVLKQLGQGKFSNY